MEPAITHFSAGFAYLQVNFMHMARYDDEAACQSFTWWRGIKGVLPIPCRDRGDELGPLEFTQQLFAEVRSPKRLVAEEKTFHPTPSSTDDDGCWLKTGWSRSVPKVFVEVGGREVNVVMKATAYLFGFREPLPSTHIRM